MKIAFSSTFDECCAQLSEYCQAQSERLVLLCDENVYQYYGHSLSDHWQCQHIPHHCIIIPHGEQQKNQHQKTRIEHQLLHWQCGRDTLLVALGGGVVCDLAGFVASTYCRGIKVIYCPTTLLAMVDASIGGKTGINTPFGKNMLGSFYSPIATFVCDAVLNTLPTCHTMSGLAEMLKHGLIADDTHWDACDHWLSQFTNKQPDFAYLPIAASRKIKQHIVSIDPYEQGQRALLNLGHSVAHAIEAASNYQISHGHAVALGLLCEAKLACEMGILNPHDHKKIGHTLNRLLAHFPKLSKLSSTAIMHYWQLDKKNQQQHRHCILLKRIGQCHVVDQQYSHAITKAQAASCIDELNQWSISCSQPA